jgi:hypothetical protein
MQFTVMKGYAHTISASTAADTPQQQPLQPATFFTRYILYMLHASLHST